MSVPGAAGARGAAERGESAGEGAVDPRARIRVLPSALAIKIAAGEVIERPASVVKELVENALDAGARRVVVEVEGGGLELIRVADDGEGMAPEDAPLAFIRHATSKIREEADLERLTTLGFRGEALPSMAAVAAVELTTRARGAATGVRVNARGGDVVEIREAGAPEGTSVTVRELFAAVPARRKFLKSVATELGHVVEVVTRHALACTDVHFRLLHHGREIALFPAVAGLEERVRQAFGRERAHASRAIDDSGLGIAVRGVLLSPHLSFASTRFLYVYVNGRPVRDRGLTHAVLEGYASLIPRGRFPGAVLLLTLPSADVDVNVHPAKSEVRFRLAHVVHDQVVRAVRRALAAAGSVDDSGGVADALARYATRLDTRPSLAGLMVPPPAQASGRAAAAFGVDAPAPAAPATGAPVGAGGERAGPPGEARAGFAALRFVGQVFRGYIVCEGADRLVLIDQHAAHERVAFERLRAQYRRGAVERQALLLPVTVDVGPAQAEAVEQAVGRLAALGFEVEAFGEHTFLVRAVPALLGGGDPRPLLEDLAESLAESGSEHSADEAAEAILSRVACHSVVRVGQALTAPEVQALLGALDALSYGTNCPHGRPVSIEYTRGQIERMFGR